MNSMHKEYTWSIGWKQPPNNLTSFLLFPKNMLDYARQKVANYGANYVPFALFMTFNYMLPFFMHVNADLVYYEWILTIKTIGAVLCVGLLLEPYWPAWLKTYFSIYWYFSLFYCLPFATTLLFLINGSSTEWLINVSLAITLLIVLADWVTFVILSVLGVFLGIIFYQYFIGSLPILSIDTTYTLIYACLFAMLIGLIFARRKELGFDFLLQRNQYLSDVQQKTRRELVQALNYREELLQELNPDEVEIFDSTTAAYIRQVIYRVRDYLRLEVSKINIGQLLIETEATLKLQALAPQPTISFKQYTQVQTIQADYDKLKELLVNSIICVQKHNTTNNPMIIGLEDATLGHEIAHMEDYTRKLEALKLTITTAKALPPTQDIYPMSLSKPQAPQNATELALVENARIIDAHYGYADISQDTTHVYVIPVNLREVRGKVMELLKEPVAEDPEELKHPLAIQLEKELLDKLQGSEVDLAVIHKALKTIKKYHGGVRRKSGEPFFTHPIAVALILLDYSKDQDAVIAALLHDTVEDTSLSIDHINAMFGKTVAFLVGKATNLAGDIRKLNLANYENIHRLINYEDPRAALVKLSDRLHNMRTISGHPSIAKQKRIADETLTFFVPMAKGLEIAPMAQELEKLSLEILNKKH